jgi:3'-phosphoadenosine 5'-phosphosulfate sulfotransferase (PAPS reductase)/FAD synthetase
MDTALLVRATVGGLHGAGVSPMQVAGFRAHATSTAYARKLHSLRAHVASLDAAISYVSFSAGKDSAVVAHACHAAHPGIAILMVDPGCPTHWTERERTRWLEYARDHDWNLRLFTWDKWGATAADESVDQYRARVHGAMFADLHAHAAAAGLTCRVMGMRAAESRQRAMLVATRGERYSYQDGSAAALPLARWSTRDVWAYIVANGLPWLDIYDALGPDARNGLIGRNGERYGRAEYLREHFPEAWRWAVARGVL